MTDATLGAARSWPAALYYTTAMAILLTSTASSVNADVAPSDRHWVRAWGSALQAPENYEDYPGIARAFHNVTLRERLALYLPAHRLRLWFSNEYGTRPLVIGSAHVARSEHDAVIASGTDRALSFGGRPSVAVPPGALVVSDVVELDVAAGSILAVSLHILGSTEGSPNTVHQNAARTNFVSKTGDFTGSAELPVETALASYFFVCGVDVEAPISAQTIVALGDSITDGYGATPAAGRSWPEDLGRRLAGTANLSVAVVNMGIGGNRLLHDLTGPAALARFDRDVTVLPGVRYLIVLEGINDIGGAEWFARPEEDVTAQDIIGALRQLISRAHGHGIATIGATLTPTAGSLDPGYDSATTEKKRQAVNAWIREAKEFDWVVDFDAVIRDPSFPSRIKPDYDSGDHLHPNDAGYAAMAAAINLSTFTRRKE